MAGLEGYPELRGKFPNQQGSADPFEQSSLSVVSFSFVPCQTRKVVMWSDVWLRAADSSGGKTNVRVGSALDLNTSPASGGL